MGYHLSHDVVTSSCKSRRFDCLPVSLHQAIRATGYTVPFILRWSAVISAFSILIVPASCSLGSPLLYHSPVVFLDRGHPRFGNFISTIPVFFLFFFSLERYDPELCEETAR